MFLLIGLLFPNVALNKEATQSSNYHHIEGKDGARIGFDDPDEAHYAVDGNFGTNVIHFGHRCAITKADAGAWWQVDLKYEFEIIKVAVTTRKHCTLYTLTVLESTTFY